MEELWLHQNKGVFMNLQADTTVTEISSSLGKKLAVLAKLKGLTQEQIAKSCQMSRISVNRFFRSHTEIRAGDLGSLLGTLGINLESLIDRAIEKQMNGGGQTAEDPIYYDVATIMQGLDELTRKTLLDQIKFWSHSLKGGAERRAAERLASGS
jgi:transcriptional regulator with XRE-family HTH domain